IQRPYAGNFGGGNLVLYDLENYVDQTVTVSGGTGTASESATIMQARTDDVPTTAGSFLSAFPLWDNTGRTLVIWSQCRLVENDRPVPCTAERLAAPAFVPARPSFSIYMYEHGKQRMLPVLLPEENVYYSEVVVAQERAYPRVINDIAAAASEPGILHIRSIYDIDGTFDNRGGAATTLADMSNPAVTPASNRPARFLRLLKAVSLPDRNTAVNNARFGSSSARDGMKELIGYAPIEPDGSVKVRVPANVAFTFQIVDFRGRRLANGPTRHLNYWLQVRPGETLECGGCHDGGTAVPHGRSGLVSSINSGAPGTQFPGTDPAMVAVSNETMAETRTRISCLTDCAGLNPTMGLVFDDVWADVGSKEASFSYRFSNAYDYNDTSTRKPVSKPCDDNWTPACLAVYNYGYHIHPFWTRTRTDILGNSVTCVDAGCHNTIDPVVPGGVTLPEPMINPAYPSPAVDVEPVIMRQLNLSDESLADPSNNALRCRAYNDLVIGDLLKEVSGTILVPVEVQVTTANPNPTPPPAFLIETQNRNVGRPISGGNANGSNAFFNELENDSTVALPTPLPGNKYDHRGLMTAAEMKVLSEWIDMGAQYYNDPTSSLPNYAGCSVP
ncbi:MAG: hypothetical protein OEY07_20480, partial [Gammaproteobacteria bacterium]|nr:hypothetical protein [Gammaproteobacteria bacterium]